MQARDRSQPHLLNIHDKGKLQLGVNRGVKQNPVVEQLGKMPASKPGPTTLGGGDVGS